MAGGSRPLMLKELVLADLRRAQRLIARINDEIDPQFRIASQEGDYWIAMTLSDGAASREREMRLISDFMAWKSSPGFVMASEIKEPDAVYAVGVTQKETIGALSVISRNPLRFSEVQWLARPQLGDDIPGLLPRGSRQLTAERLRELDVFFGPRGKFPAMRIGNE